MPRFKVVNPELHTRAESSSPPPDRRSVRSFVSSSEYTVFSDPKKSFEGDESLPRYIDDGAVTLPEKEKHLPALPLYEKTHRPYDDYDPYATDHTDPHYSSSSSSAHAYMHPLTTAVQLASALGPDNVPYSTEIDSIPCAGVRIPHGPLSGLLAWRLVIRTPPNPKGKRSWWSETKRVRRNSHSHTLFPLPPPIHSASYSDTPVAKNRLTSMSTASLPMLYARNLSSTPEPMQRPVAIVQPPTPASLSRQSHVYSHSHSRSNYTDHTPPPTQPTIHDNPSSGSNALITNFILDTSLPYNIISRDTLAALGYPAYRLPAVSTPHSDPHAPTWEEFSSSIPSSNSQPLSNLVTLTVQNVLTKFRIARPGEASRLGVQFLHDAGVSVFFPRDGEGVGPVLYLESARLLRDVPRTITSLPHHNGGRGGLPKMTLQQRVRALFGLG